MSGALASSGSEASAARLWRSIDAEQYLVAACNDEFALYHRPSGKTHFLNAAGMALIADILTEPQTVERAARELAGIDPDQDCDAEFVQYVARTMARLTQIGFVYPA